MTSFIGGLVLGIVLTLGGVVLVVRYLVGLATQRDPASLDTAIAREHVHAILRSNHGRPS